MRNVALLHPVCMMTPLTSTVPAYSVLKQHCFARAGSMIVLAETIFQVVSNEPALVWVLFALDEAHCQVTSLASRGSWGALHKQ